MIKNFNFKDTDKRVKKYIIPNSIISKNGKIENESIITAYQDRQIQLQERNFMTMSANSYILLDFGCEFHGGVCISVYKVKGDTKAKLHLRFGESVGEALAPLEFKGACNDHSARDFCVDVVSFSTNEYATTGYRFLYIGLESDCEVLIKTVQGVFIYNDYEYVGGFECSDKRLNEIYNVSAYTCHLCMQNQLWDGIKRDRLIWIGDMSPELKTIKYVFGDVPEVINGLRLALEDAPLPKWINTMPNYSLWWLINLNEWYEYTGNFTYLEAFKDYIIKLTEQIIENIDENGIFIPDHFIDWPTMADPQKSTQATRALVIMCMNACENMCSCFGYNELVKKCAKVKTIASKNTVDCGEFKQLAALTMLTKIADENAKELLKSGGASGFSTFMSYYILSAMAEVTDTDSVLSALREYYGGMLDMGATTFWEDFDIKWLENASRIDEIPKPQKSDIHGDNGNYCYRGYRHSLCHGWASGPVPFLTEYILGVELVDGCKKINISPHLGSLKYAKGSIATPYGKLSVQHTKNTDGTITTIIDAPKEIEIKNEKAEF